MPEVYEIVSIYVVIVAGCAWFATILAGLK